MCARGNVYRERTLGAAVNYIGAAARAMDHGPDGTKDPCIHGPGPQEPLVAVTTASSAV